MYLTAYQLAFTLVACFIAGGCLGVLVMCIFQCAGSLGEDDPQEFEQAHGYVDQDGERVYYADGLGAVGTRSDPDAWKNLNGVKVQHARDAE